MKIPRPVLTGWFVPAILGLLLLSACGADGSTQRTAAEASIPQLPELPAKSVSQPVDPAAAQPEAWWVLEVPRLDEQGAVSVEITPLNLNVPGYTLDFSVALNTHSVDLSMDLAALAILTTNTGQELPAAAWDAPRGGHHVQGVLQFPAVQNGEGVLDGVKRLTLIIRDLDAPERAFVWER